MKECLKHMLTHTHTFEDGMSVCEGPTAHSARGADKASWAQLSQGRLMHVHLWTCGGGLRHISHLREPGRLQLSPRHLLKVY